MSDRRTSSETTRMRDLLRDFEDRLQRLEGGGALAGHVSFGSVLDIGADLTAGGTGGVEIEVTPYPDEFSAGRRITFTNMLTGSTSVIDLP